MKRSLLFAMTFALACRTSSSGPPAPTADAAPATPSGAFEGEIELAVPPLFFVTSKLKGNKSHFIFKKGVHSVAGELFVDSDAKKVYTPLGARKYAELGLSMAAPQRPLTATSTGKKETVLGHECEILTVADGAMRREICLARDLPAMHINIGPTKDGQGFQPSFGEGFPLRIVIYDASGTAVHKMEAVRIEPKVLPDTDVEIRSDWEKVVIDASVAP